MAFLDVSPDAGQNDNDHPSRRQRYGIDSLKICKLAQFAWVAKLYDEREDSMILL